MHNPDHYAQFLGERKISATPIPLRPKPTNANWLAGSSSLQHPTFSPRLVSELHIQKRTNFKFSLIEDTFGASPSFRFDSEGPAHRNRFEDVPLPEQQITTPHFHRFSQDGSMIAYKSEKLLDTSEAAAICGDIQLGLAHFCHEGNIRTEVDGFPVVVEEAPPLIDLPVDDPLADLAIP